MPNGGSPMQMLLRPRQGNVVILCDGGNMRVYARDAWEALGRKAEPICTLTAHEAGALAWHLDHWLDSDAVRPGHSMGAQLIDASYDW